MNNLLKLFTLVGTGLILGSMAGQLIRTDRFRINRMLGIGDEGNEVGNKDKNEALTVSHEEHENCFI